MRRSPLLLHLFIAGALASRAPATLAAAAEPTLTTSSDTLRADVDGVWRTDLLVQNRLDTGLYPDSLTFDWVNEDPDSSTDPRRGTESLNSLVMLMQPAGAGEQAGMSWVGPAMFERGSLHLRMVMHDAKHEFHVLTADARVVGSDLGDRHPSELLSAGRERVEVTILRADTTRASVPGLLFVPPAGTSARSQLRWATTYARRGSTVAIVSLPGSGRSTGHADRAGPASVAAVNAALERLAHEPGVDAQRLLVWGQLDGATTALLAAVKHPELQGVIAQNASFDPWATWRAWPESERNAYVREAGSDSAAWRVRSPLAVAKRIASPVLVLQTLDAPLPGSQPAQAFAAARTEANLYIESRLSATEALPFRRADALRVAADFMQRRTRHP